MPREYSMELDLELDVIEREPTVLEYARFHGICSDYTQELLQLFHSVSLSDETFDLDLRDPKDAPPLANPADELIKERLAVTKEAATLLKSVLSLEETPTELVIPDGRRRIRSLKQEVPILRTDNDLDLLEFGNTVEPSFSNLKIPIEPINEENDEGLEWPSKYSAFPAQCVEQAKKEKLEVSREILLYLQDAIRDSDLPEGSEIIKEEALRYQKNSRVRPVTPPLLPLTPPLTPYIPSSPGNHLELLSDDSMSTLAEAKALEERIMGADALARHDSDGSDLMLLDMVDTGEYDLSLDDVNSPSTKRKASDLKVEGPLTPPLFSESPEKKLKTVAFADMLIEYIPEFPVRYGNGNAHDHGSKDAIRNDPELPSHYENGDDVLSPEDDYAFYKDLEPLAGDANWRVENEKLSEADTTRRMNVPHVDFRMPIAPWDEFTRSNANSTSETELDAQAKFLQSVKRNNMRSATSWHGVSELERTLPLAPFSYGLAKVSIEENLHGGEVLAKMLDDGTKGEIATSSTDLWKKDGLRILEDTEQDEEVLEPSQLEECNDINSLIRKRQLEMHETAGDHKPVPVTVADSTSHTPKSQHRDLKSIPAHGQPVLTREKDTSLMFGGRFSATSALDNFMALQGMLSKPGAAGSDASKANQPLASTVPSVLRPVKQTHDNIKGLPNSGVQPALETTWKPVDLPPLPQNMPPCSFVISSTLLQRRGLSRQIERLYPDAEFVSRDFDSPHAASKEADLILSPSTGLMLTTLQQLKQRALPGQPDRSPIKERMMALQNMYERLVVLASEGLSCEPEEQTLSWVSDPRDQEAITKYEEIAAQMGGEVLVRYVPGGEHALARVIVGEMARFGLPHGSRDIGDIKLLPDQSTWESFLRRVGLNAFAAQVILALLKDPVDWPNPFYNVTKMTSETMQTCGLQTFLFMSAERRVQSFQAVLGGSRILAKVSTLLDEAWLSAAHGFRV